MIVLLKQFIIEQKLFYRNPISVFWTYLFPLFIMAIVGWFFNDNYKPTNKTLYINDSVKSDVSKSIIKELDKYFVIIENKKKGNQKLTALKLSIIENKESGYTIRLYKTKGYDYSNDINALHKALYKINNSLSSQQALEKPSKRQRVPLLIEEVNGENDKQKYSDFLAPGMIAMAIMSSCIFGVGISLTSYREKGNLRRLALTPLKKSVFILAHILHRYAVILIQSFLLLLSAKVLFDLEFKGDILSLLLVLTTGLIAFISVGFIVASRTAKAESANALSNITFYPLLLLGCVYFPLENIPLILRPLAEITPLFHLTKALRAVINQGIPFYALSSNILPLLITTLICFIISVKLFRWE